MIKIIIIVWILLVVFIVRWFHVNKKKRENLNGPVR